MASETIERLDQLSDADARVDGFDNLAAMKRALHQIYPPRQRDGRRWFRIGFRLQDDAGEVEKTKMEDGR